MKTLKAYKEEVQHIIKKVAGPTFKYFIRGYFHQDLNGRK